MEDNFTSLIQLKYVNIRFVNLTYSEFCDITFFFLTKSRIEAQHTSIISKLFMLSNLLLSEKKLIAIEKNPTQVAKSETEFKVQNAVLFNAIIDSNIS